MAYSKKTTLSHGSLQLMIAQDSAAHITREYNAYRAVHGVTDRARRPVKVQTIVREASSGSAHPPILINFVTYYVGRNSKNKLKAK